MGNTMERERRIGSGGEDYRLIRMFEAEVDEKL